MLDDKVVAKFWKRVDRRGQKECWPWIGSKTLFGYGRLPVGRVNVPATRISWQIANNADWPDGLSACHSCDNPNCVNPTHIWPGTHLENMQDMILKGRCRARGGRQQDADRAKPNHAFPCKKCGHIRNDDYRDTCRGKPTWKCRACNLNRARARADARREVYRAKIRETFAQHPERVPAIQQAA